MRVWLIAGAAVLLLSAAGLVGWRLQKRKQKIQAWLRETFLCARFYEVLKTFCSEAAVLWLVFPMVDVWEDANKKWLVVYVSPVFVLFFMFLSGLAARKEELERKREVLR